MKATASETQAAAIAALLRRASLPEAEVQRRTRRALAAGLTRTPAESKPTESTGNTDEEI